MAGRTGTSSAKLDEETALQKAKVMKAEALGFRIRAEASPYTQTVYHGQSLFASLQEVYG